MATKIAASKAATARLDAAQKADELASNNIRMALGGLLTTTEALFGTLGTVLHTTSTNKGFWPPEGRNEGECIALMHSELSEALEALRDGNPPSQKCGEGITQLEEELADCVIRILDFAAANELNIGRALVMKADYNTFRQHKHGKGF